MTQLGESTEDVVRRVWAEVLDVASVPVDVNFFDAGGHSLLLMVLQQSLTEAVGLDIAIEDLFVHTTVRAQAAMIRAGTAR